MSKCYEWNVTDSVPSLYISCEVYYRLCLPFITCTPAAFMIERFAHVGVQRQTNILFINTFIHTHFLQDAWL